MLTEMTINAVHLAAVLASQLWQSTTEEELTHEFTQVTHNESEIIYLYLEANEAIGFAHASLRMDYVEETSTTPVGYLEGVYVLSEHRRKGIAQILLSACDF
ncbi:GNAT family N-acetyltransferase [Marinilactibacillus piezotolerans]|uniref:GNAT family N-acetyltransferase n=1 Tax=Marinilactibacillus piezotolerans TaxID=258723 RepID=UPI001C4E2232|nr:GNAT family N-acetyltransferase [Marinilactibacillus piezotolerans]